MSSSLTATDYKNAGNKLCSLFRFDEAINYYNKAILKSPEVAILYSNRALCHLKLQQWQSAIQDCRRALELEPNLIKAHFFLGQALAELANYDDALKHLQRAHELAKEKKLNFGDDIAYQIRWTKRRRWNKIEDEATQLEDKLEEYLIDLIKKDTRQQLEKLEQPRTAQTSSQPDEESISRQHHQQEQESIEPSASTSSADPTTTAKSLDCKTSSVPPTAPPSGNSIDLKNIGSSSSDESVAAATQIEAQQIRIQSKCDSYLNKLELMFNNLKMQRKKRDVPDYLCGKISFEIMHDPVITPSGITYDRQDIEEHLKRVGHFDPITRQPLLANQLISNLAMKEVVDAYLNENEWAHYY